MIKLLYFTDPHNKPSNPTGRLDNFRETIFNKQRYVGQHLAKELGVDAIAIGGDILDKPDNPDSFVRELQRLYLDFGIPVYSVIGNHEEYGYNPETFNKTSFGLLEGPRIVGSLSMEEPIILEDGEGTKVSITGCHANFNLDKGGRTFDYTDVPDVPGAVKIHIVHGFLNDQPEKWEKIPTTYIGEILHTKADIVLTGHEHSGFEVIKVTKSLIEEYNNKLGGKSFKFTRTLKAHSYLNSGDKIYCNPGALARVSCSVGDVNLEVKVALITIDKDEYSIELIKLPSEIAKPSNEVLDRDKLLQEKQARKQLETFIEKVSEKETISSFDPYEVLNELAQEDDLGDNIVEGVRKRLQIAEEQLAGEKQNNDGEKD